MLGFPIHPFIYQSLDVTDPQPKDVFVGNLDHLTDTRGATIMTTHMTRHGRKGWYDGRSATRNIPEILPFGPVVVSDETGLSRSRFAESQRGGSNDIRYERLRVARYVARITLPALM
jgi:hypothetical protein